MASSAGRKTVAVMRGLMMLCDSCYDQVMAEKLTDYKNFVQNYEALFDTICPGCTDINGTPVDDMLGSSVKGAGKPARYFHSFPLKYMQVDSPDLTFHVLIRGI